MEIRGIPVDHVHRPSTARAIDPRTVESLAASISEIGLLQPIIVSERSVPVRGIMVPGYLLIAGGHRLEAHRSLGRSEIPARVVAGESLETELIEIDENLCRAELSAAQRSAHIARRKQIWQALHPAGAVPEWEKNTNAETGGATCATSEDRLPDGRRKGPQHQKDFAASTAEITGTSKSTINRQVAIAEALGDDLQKVEGTSLDKGTELAALAKMEPEERKEIIQRAGAGERVSAVNRHDDQLQRLVKQALNEVSKLVNYGSSDEIETAARRIGITDGAREILTALLSATVPYAVARW